VAGAESGNRRHTAHQEKVMKSCKLSVCWLTSRQVLLAYKQLAGRICRKNQDQHSKNELRDPDPEKPWQWLVGCMPGRIPGRHLIWNLVHVGMIVLCKRMTVVGIGELKKGY